jgi:hypothetical protein
MKLGAATVPTLVDINVPKFKAVVPAASWVKTLVVELTLEMVKPTPVAVGIAADTVNVVDAKPIPAWPNKNNPPKIKLNLVFMYLPFQLWLLLI